MTPFCGPGPGKIGIIIGEGELGGVGVLIGEGVLLSGLFEIFFIFNQGLLHFSTKKDVIWPNKRDSAKKGIFAKKASLCQKSSRLEWLLWRSDVLMN